MGCPLRQPSLPNHLYSDPPYPNSPLLLSETQLVTNESTSEFDVPGNDAGTGASVGRGVVTTDVGSYAEGSWARNDPVALGIKRTVEYAIGGAPMSLGVSGGMKFIENPEEVARAAADATDRGVCGVDDS